MNAFRSPIIVLTSILLSTSLIAQQAVQATSPPVAHSGQNHVVANQPTAFTGGILAQTLGPWELSPPTSASLVSGGGVSFGWLNTSNAALSLSAAMASSPIENGGYANADLGTVIEIAFAGGVVNDTGADLVLLDAEFDVGTYTVSSSFDGFASSVAVDTAFGTLVSTVGYYYEHNGAGPFTANIVGVEIDLTALGVPVGVPVTSFRLTCTNAACDPVSLAKIDSGLSLTVSTLGAGTFGTFDVANGTALGTIGIGLSLAGNTPTLVNTGVCGPLVVNLVPPIQVLTTGAADASGAFSYSLMIPANASGVTVHFQALDFSSCSLSNGVTTTVL